MESSGYASYVRARAVAVGSRAPIDSGLAVKWAERAVAEEPTPYYRHVLGLALVRSGQYERAIGLFERNLKPDVHWVPELDWLGLALAHHHLGHTEEVRRCLDRPAPCSSDCDVSSPTRPRTRNCRSTITTGSNSS